MEAMAKGVIDLFITIKFRSGNSTLRPSCLSELSTDFRHNCIILSQSERAFYVVSVHSNSFLFPIMTSFDFKTWCSHHGLKQKTIHELGKSDLDSQEALKLVHANDIATLDLTLGQRKLLLQALAELNSAEKIPKAGETRPIETTPVTNKTLASNGGLEESY